MAFQRKSKSGRVTIGITFYVEKAFYGQIKAAAKADKRTVCSWVIKATTEKIERPLQ